jgi:hypothetical protein
MKTKRMHPQASVFPGERRIPIPLFHPSLSCFFNLSDDSERVAKEVTKGLSVLMDVARVK